MSKKVKIEKFVTYLLLTKNGIMGLGSRVLSESPQSGVLSKVQCPGFYPGVRGSGSYLRVRVRSPVQGCWVQGPVLRVWGPILLVCLFLLPETINIQSH